ncbi:MAG: 4Fe-4S binding protein [Coriobacteriales bacterium]|jgi:ferredoxin|nr:4Fe-4S binding protein [Coriobacteriales bacterium]
MPDIVRVIESLGKLESPAISVHAERCVVVRNRNAQCQKCARACTSGAIAIDGNELSISPDICIGCGTCATVCPTAALEAQHPNDAELLLRASQVARERQQLPLLACSQLLESHKDGYDTGLVIELGCLARLDESELVALIALGMPKIVLARADCAACPNKTGQETWELVGKTLDVLLASWGQANPVCVVEGLPAEVQRSAKEAQSQSSSAVFGMSRRDFFTQIKTGALSVASDMAGSTVLSETPAPQETTTIHKVMKDGTLPHFIPSRRERLLDHLDRIGSPVEETIDTRLWGYARIDPELCNSCRMCATFCPTGAIYKFDDSDGTFGVEHYPADCVQCRLCQDICPTSALVISSEVALKQLVEGTIERHEMRPVKSEPGRPDSIYRAMYDLLGGGQIYER